MVALLCLAILVVGGIRRQRHIDAELRRRDVMERELWDRLSPEEKEAEWEQLGGRRATGLDWHSFTARGTGQCE